MKTRSWHQPDREAGSTLVLHAVGARPNFVKIAPLMEALAHHPGIRQHLVHTGQHYDRRMSEEIFSDLELPQPDVFLGVGSGSHAEQTAKVLVAFEPVLLELRPALVVVAGDVNSTLACALAAAKLGIPVAHVESGLRSFDWDMPEEINRVLTDRLSNLLFTHSPEAVSNLLAEGIAPERIHQVGNTMIDSLRRFEQRARRRMTWSEFGVGEGEYVLVTLHRPSNVDDPERLLRLAGGLEELAARLPVVFPVHPRTAARLEASGAMDSLKRAGVTCTAPLGYLSFLSLTVGAGAVLTDSGGVQEETTALGVPCFTLRRNTERPVTISLGTNTLLGDDPVAIRAVTLDGGRGRSPSIPGWDGSAGERAADAIVAAVGPAARTDLEWQDDPAA